MSSSDVREFRGRSTLWSILYGVGMASVFVGERLIGAGSARAMSAVGVLLVLLALGMRLFRTLGSSDDTRRIERALLMLYVLGALSLALYFAQSDLASSLFGEPLEKSSPKLAVVLAALWPALLIAAAAPIVLAEMAYAGVARAPRLEAGRIRDALLSGLGLAGALVFAFSIAYVGAERDKKVDFSYFRTARPGESSRKIVQTLDQPIQVSLFFPPANEVREEVIGYFQDLARESKLLELHSYDYAIDPAKAKELAVTGNGTVVVSRGGRREPLAIGLELEGARNQLRNLDKEVQKRLLQLARPGRTVYLTTGHGERATVPGGDTDKRLTIRDLKELLIQQSYAVKELGVADGLGVDVPSDAAIVLVIGPQKPFFPEEVASISRYLDRSGRLFVALDPENGLDMKELLQPLGLSYSPSLLANDQVYARKDHQPSDRLNIATGSYSSHPAVTTLSHLGMRAPMVLLGAGSFEERKDKSKELTIDFAVKAHPSTFNDLNGNYTFDSPAETRKGWPLAAAITKKKAGGKPTDEMRALLLADSDAICDGVVGNPANAYFVIDGMKWLLGDEAITGEISNENDVAIAHTHKQDVIWFYASIFLAPLFAFGVGSMVTRRRRPRGPHRPAGGTGKSGGADQGAQA